MASTHRTRWGTPACTGLAVLVLAACGGTAAPPVAPPAAPTQQAVPHGAFDPATGLYRAGPDIPPAPSREASFVAVVRGTLPASTRPGWSDRDWVDAGHSACQDLSAGTGKTVAAESRDLMGVGATYEQAHTVVMAATEQWCWDPYRELREPH